MGRDVIIFDTTLRDGEQAPGNSMTAEEKLRLARQLDTLGVDVIEAGFPSASEGDRRAVRAIAEDVRRPVIAALARCHDRDIDLAGEAVRPAARPRVHVFIATSDLHLECKLRLSRDQCLERAREAVQRARRYTDDVEFSAEDATRTDLEFLCRVVEAAIAAGATTINLPDTVGYALPVEYGAMFRAVRERVPNADRVVFSAHCHDDLGLAVANSLAAIEAGAGQVECTVNGIGERAGNAALEEIVVAGRVRPHAVAFHCGVNPQELFRTSQLLSHVIGVFPQPNKAVVGRNAFAHEAGIHQHGVLQNGLTYEIIRPEEVGVARSSLVLGKHSGRHALERRYRELGYEVDDATLRKLYDEFTTLADKKREILDEDLLTPVARSVPRRAGSLPAGASAGDVRHRVRDGGGAPRGSLEWKRAGRDGGRQRPDRRDVRGDREGGRAPGGRLEPRRPVGHPGARQSGAGAGAGANRREIVERARRVDGHRRGERPRPGARPEQGEPRGPAGGPVAQRQLLLGSVSR